MLQHAQYTRLSPSLSLFLWLSLAGSLARSYIGDLSKPHNVRSKVWWGEQAEIELGKRGLEERTGQVDDLRTWNRSEVGHIVTSRKCKMAGIARCAERLGTFSQVCASRALLEDRACVIARRVDDDADGARCRAGATRRTRVQLRALREPTCGNSERAHGAQSAI